LNARGSRGRLGMGDAVGHLGHTIYALLDW
jgi:hypothetical protein